MQQCQSITRKSASNLALAFVLLPKAKSEGMAALYAFCREVDDIADDESVPVQKRREQLALWRDDVRKACQGISPKLLVNRELQPVIRQFNLPFHLFDELVRGVEMDLDTRRYETFDQLDLYCYRVASVVGLLSIEIFGYTNPACRDYAVYLGKALQLTNILRDIGGDAARGRIYLPLSELARHDVTPGEILQGRHSDRLLGLTRSIAERARQFYRLARETLPAVDRRNMVAAELMAAVYWKLLCKLEARNFPVFEAKPTRLNKAQKLLLVLGAWLRLVSGSVSPAYGY
jgi:phytoene synthase